MGIFRIGFGFCTPLRTFGDLVCFFVSVINALIPILIALAVLGFFWGVFRYGFSSDSEEGIQEGKTVMLYGIIALFVMVSIWGILNVLTRTFLFY
ncbi:hypothetical protein HYW58_00575 [Candidatus Kaiserbacteria bacterium]|nr:hypothetical protein [Candidatus Kaiserbacteria bacterium]